MPDWTTGCGHYVNGIGIMTYGHGDYCKHCGGVIQAVFPPITTDREEG